MAEDALRPNPDTVLGKRVLITTAEDSTKPTDPSVVAVTEGTITAKDESPEHEGQVVEELTLTATWNGKKFVLQTPVGVTVGELKSRLADITGVKPERMKLMGFVKGRLPADDIVLSSLNLKKDHGFMMMGTVEEKIWKDPTPADLPDVFNDFDFDYQPDDTYLASDTTNRKKLRQTIEKTSIFLINELRPGKGMLVLDLDYTLFDCKSSAGHISQLMRPGMHELLTAVYPYYDICIWSQTAWRYLEMKITELGILLNPAYRIAFVLDRTSMFSITNMARKKDGEAVKHEVKALEIIWAKFPKFYNAKNTIHIDDLSRNFAMNPQSGLKISAFKNAPTTRATDRELFPLAKYLLQISLVDDFRTLNHKVLALAILK
ncbi:hypothetical protein HK097_003056 [Rhizophlyctis rosea]|uniref:protein-serine/threonine phosphatase n=1 Tax=Rhizophlyctis rosea TaxID=64517 RepID=A0AAD5SJM0_9FUNG|nr:hypothetical protein HK097_003056 [Rhizophlyctis rosea]